MNYHLPSDNNIPARLETISNDISFSRKTSTHNASYTYHRHNGCEIYLFLSGNIHLYIEQSCFLLEPGSLVVLNPNEMHRIHCIDTSPYERIVINIKRDYLQKLSTDDFSLEKCFFSRALGQNNLCVLSKENLTRFLFLYDNLCQTASDSYYGRQIAQNSYVALLLLFINQQFQTNSSVYRSTMPDYIAQSMQYIDTHLESPLHLSVLAEQFHISKNYLSMQFKKHTGLTLRSYILDRKIQYAKTLLQKGTTVTDACFQSGFNDYANFIRSFTKYVGISPGKYRLSVSKNANAH